MATQIAKQQRGEGQIEGEVQVHAQQGQPAQRVLDARNVRDQPIDEAHDQDQDERVDAAQAHVGEDRDEQHHADERDPEPRRGMEEHRLVPARRKLAHADALQVS